MPVGGRPTAVAGGGQAPPTTLPGEGERAREEGVGDIGRGAEAAENADAVAAAAAARARSRPVLAMVLPGLLEPTEDDRGWCCTVPLSYPRGVKGTAATCNEAALGSPKSAAPARTAAAAAEWEGELPASAPSEPMKTMGPMLARPLAVP
mmetsp:Transcript_38054/g.122333  ORF Transcript_38054/g.122333 Transcript_38054/m.122333 type:complete len:150 (-) Transcript_38054:175-624(-)